MHGDTFSTLLGAIAGRLAGMRVAHVESGLSSGNWRHPFPEELTRRLVFRLTDLALCPGPAPSAHLRGRRGLTVVDTGENTLLDTLRFAAARRAEHLAPGTGPYFVCSIHRFENVFQRDRLARITDIVLRLADTDRCLFVLHPVTRRQLDRFGLRQRLEQHRNVELLGRVTYIPFIGLCSRARFVVSDGGSNQEELAYLGVPTVLMRDATERAQGLDQGTTLISRLDADRILRFVSTRCPPPDAHRFRALQAYARLQPSARILDALAAPPPQAATRSTRA